MQILTSPPSRKKYKKFASGSFIGRTVNGTNTPPNYYDNVVTGLAFEPKIIYVTAGGTATMIRNYIDGETVDGLSGAVTISLQAKTTSGFTCRYTCNQVGQQSIGATRWWAFS